MLAKTGIIRRNEKTLISMNNKSVSIKFNTTISYVSVYFENYLQILMLQRAVLYKRKQAGSPALVNRW